MDGIIPDCETDRGCLIPELEQEGRRILEIRSLIVRLAGVVDAGTVLRMAAADLDDLALLAVVEDELRRRGGATDG